MKLEEISKDIKSILIQLTKLNGRVGKVEDYKEKHLEPVVEEYYNRQGTLWLKRIVAGTLITAFVGAIWSTAYFVFNSAVDKIIERKNWELVEQIEELNDQLKNLDFEINIEEVL